MFGEVVLDNREVPADLMQPIELTSRSCMGDPQDDSYSNEFLFTNQKYSESPFDVKIDEWGMSGITDMINAIPLWALVAGVAALGFVVWKYKMIRF